MRLLGYLFVIALLLAAVGWFRGWFAISTTHAAGKDEVTLEVDQHTMRDDAKAAGKRLGELSAKAVVAVKSLGSNVSADESTLEGTLSVVDRAARDLTFTAGGETIELHVPPGIPLTRDGKAVDFDQLQPATRVKFAFEHAGEDRALSRIEILH